MKYASNDMQIILMHPVVLAGQGGAKVVDHPVHLINYIDVFFCYAHPITHLLLRLGKVMLGQICYILTYLNLPTQI